MVQKICGGLKYWIQQHGGPRLRGENKGIIGISFRENGRKKMETLSIANSARSSDVKGRKGICTLHRERTEIETVPKGVGES